MFGVSHVGPTCPTESDMFGQVLGFGMTGDAPHTMSGAEAEGFVLSLLRERGPLTTMQIEKLARKEHKRCPDQTVIFLTKMKRMGLIKGEASVEKRGWLWWVP
jgi:hypothetical protein